MKSPRVLLSGLVLAMTMSSPLTLDAAQRGGPQMGGTPGNNASQNQNGAGQPRGMFGGQGFMGGQGGGHDSQGQSQGKPHHGGSGSRDYRMFSALDLDDSESLTLDEFLARPAGHRADRIDLMDADDDGQISRDEYLDAGGPFHEMDIDIDALHACISEQMSADWASPQDRETRFDDLDVNDDNFVDQGEFEAAREVSIEARFLLIDANADGAISLDEWADAFAGRREHRGIRRDCIDEQRDINSLLGE
jgi:hypothetical protein